MNEGYVSQFNGAINYSLEVSMNEIQKFCHKPTNFKLVSSTRKLLTIPTKIIYRLCQWSWVVVDKAIFLQEVNYNSYL